MSFQYRFRRAPNSPEFRLARERAYSRHLRGGMIIERDVEIPTRSGRPLFADVFRPQGDAVEAPALIAWTPYGKHDPAPLAKIYPASGVHADWMSELAIFEAPDPGYWVGHGYAVVTIDVPGLWYANAPATYLSPEETEAFYDAIEWAGTEPWSNGRVGLSGVSYLTVMQWHVAALSPPHLAAINPWEGWSDTYREVVRHGGIPETSFWPYIQVRWGASDQPVEDLWAETREHALFDSFWESKAASLHEITVPAYVVASWSDHGLHTRGTLEGFRRIRSEKKWLEVHGRKKWAHYYDPASVARQREFFDHFLKQTGPEPNWPNVRLEIRKGHGRATAYTGADWPLPEIEYRTLWLDASREALVDSPPQEQSCASYDALADQDVARFDLVLPEPTALVGHMTLTLHVSTDAGDDMDLFVAVQKLDDQGTTVGFTHFAVFEEGPVALGWLRVSHRELDAEASTHFLPVLRHRRELRIMPGEIVEVTIEILPSGTSFAAGERLRLLVGGRDLYHFPKPIPYARHEDTVNVGRHTVWTGGATSSRLRIPYLPAG